MSLEGGKQLHARLDAIADTRKFLGLIQHRGVFEAKKIARTTFTKTGTLERSIEVGALSDREAFIRATAKHAVMVERGTGIYGPRKRPIVPKRAKVLAWRTAPAGGSLRLSGRSRVSGGEETGGWAFARSVKGRKATPYLVPGAQMAIHAAGADSMVTVWNDAA
jgi:hypothetical protein